LSSLMSAYDVLLWDSIAVLWCILHRLLHCFVNDFQTQFEVMFRSLGTLVRSQLMFISL
jgi:hypothetical protein